MNWYKYSKDFSDRNIINHKIVYLEETREKLEEIAKVVFQSATTAKNTNYNILTNKKISSYPNLKSILSDAYASVLDSPWVFANLCKLAIETIDIKIAGLKQERESITNPKKNNYMKGWI